MKYLVKVSDNRHGNYDIEREILAQIDAELQVMDCASVKEMLESCADADAILLDMAPMSSEVVKGLEKCKIVSRYGVGYDNVDVAACTERGIWVTNVPDYCAEDVSDHAVAMLMSCLRQIPLRDRSVRNGKWNLPGTNSFRVSGKILGVLGAGRIARAFIRKMSGFGLAKILVYDPYVPAELISQLGAQSVDLETLLQQADFISLHMPVTDETRGMINEKTLSLMKETAILVNTGRGPLVDDKALIQALKDKRIAGAALDTHNQEPISSDSAYLEMDNVVLTDHTAYNTREAVVELKTKVAMNVVEVLQGKVPTYPVNKI